MQGGEEYTGLALTCPLVCAAFVLAISRSSTNRYASHYHLGLARAELGQLGLS
jgi:hypothetical protein